MRCAEFESESLYHHGATDFGDNLRVRLLMVATLRMDMRAVVSGPQLHTFRLP